MASITRHIDGDIALTNDDEDNNGNAFFRKGYIPAAMYSSLLCMRDLFFLVLFSFRMIVNFTVQGKDETR